MKFCEKCGNQLLDEAVMCPKCGCAVASKQPTAEQNKKAKNQLLGVIFIILGVAILVTTVSLVFMQL